MALKKSFCRACNSVAQNLYNITEAKSLGMFLYNHWVHIAQASANFVFEILCHYLIWPRIIQLKLLGNLNHWNTYLKPTKIYSKYHIKLLNYGLSFEAPRISSIHLRGIIKHLFLFYQKIHFLAAMTEPDLGKSQKKSQKKNLFKVNDFFKLTGHMT
ncbi:hypothetical protein BpHYR1_045329 [Brachionus plicatilis]|uniref:Uncharacterized protein n=1 Tax=Brachionus plicatilis TaxID=10195 RepID=A0A3M7S6Y3_BRAPC|nr:hypothetical protein BpHYR1_045329 [Brachionus plicatilis]